MEERFMEVDPPEALTGSMRDFRELRGTNLLGRVAPFYEWQEARRARGCHGPRDCEKAPRCGWAAGSFDLANRDSRDHRPGRPAATSAQRARETGTALRRGRHRAGSRRGSSEHTRI